MRASIEQLDFRFRSDLHIIVGRAALRSCTAYVQGTYNTRYSVRPCLIAVMLGRFDAVQT